MAHGTDVGRWPPADRPGLSEEQHDRLAALGVKAPDVEAGGGGERVPSSPAARTVAWGLRFLVRGFCALEVEPLETGAVEPVHPAGLADRRRPPPYA